MEPELNILPALVYLLIYHEYELRRRRQRGAVLETAGPSGAVLETAGPSGAVLDRKGPAERCLTGRAQRSGA
ncbi:hypothetical protein NDU88_002508 [Pleurodeles waltl]|uniref:Uncharacterized protein n=1 Tax=Pleurodeles waltl TaxID=8319 RepID=A0AAV7TKV1_PLEWA|nr:hypothetical protein NDU88_002508 [Pleurodeles waltl]